MNMFRKLSLAAVAAIALATAALAPTSASAWWQDGWHHGWHHGWHGGWGWGGPGFYGAYGYGGYGCRRWVDTPWGPRLRWVC
jgi:hypothetical protein